ncbi:MAG: hypothetical protein CM15mP36_06840 [Flavobacteriales bacterium]|nr:MAG: hypothetical protein CM15mP36_06840 [Flavobacteriales bacterium]
MQPEENTQPSNQTKFKLLFDDNAIYVFVKSLINPDEIVNRLTRRDQLDGDAIYIAFDSNNDKINSFVFGLSSAGTQRDVFASNNGIMKMKAGTQYGILKLKLIVMDGMQR